MTDEAMSPLRRRMIAPASYSPPQNAKPSPLGGFRTLAPQPAAPSSIGPTSENLHKGSHYLRPMVVSALSGPRRTSRTRFVRGISLHKSITVRVGINSGGPGDLPKVIRRCSQVNSRSGVLGTVT